jgi:hypothetical protein
MSVSCSFGRYAIPHRMACEHFHVETIGLPVEAVRELGEDDRRDCSSYLVRGTLVSRGLNVYFCRD